MKVARLFLLAAFSCAAGCDGEGRVRPPPSTVNFFNAAPSHQQVDFFREARPTAEARFLQSATFSFDSGPYDFRVEYRPLDPSISVGRYSFAEDLSPDLEYWFIAMSPNDELDVFVASRPKEFESTTSGRFSLAHAHPTLAAIDVYLAAPGAVLEAIAPQGSVGFKEQTAPIEVTAGTYRLYLTAAQDPSNVLFESNDIAITAGAQSFVVIADSSGFSTSGFIVTDIRDTPTPISDATQGAELRAVQTVNDRLDRDLLIDDAGLFSNLAFAAVSDYTAIGRGQRSLSLTPPGNPGVVEATDDFTAIAGRRYTAIFAGDSASGINGLAFVEDKRSIVGRATLRLINGAGLFGSIEIFVAAPGADLSVLEPAADLGAPAFSPRLGLPPGDHEITAIDAETRAVLAGPEPVSVADGGVYGVLLVNSAGGSTVDLVFLDDFTAP